MFPIERINSGDAEDLEQLGTKRKYWLRDREYLFKAEEKGTGEDWAEKLACELCKLIGIPHVHYELAVEQDSGIPGVICPNIAKAPLSLVLGNQLLFELDETYPASDSKKYGVRQHTVSAIHSVLMHLAPPTNEFTSDCPVGNDSAVDFFVGYLLLDALIANQDRHHQNWGAILGDDKSLAPSFDHGEALARNISDEERKNRLDTRDKGYGIEAFAMRAKSSIYDCDASTSPLKTHEAYFHFQEVAPGAAAIWRGKLNELDANAFSSLIDQIPNHRMTKICKEFTLQLLLVNQSKLLSS